MQPLRGKNAEKVRIGEAEFWVEVTGGSGADPQNVGVREAMSFDGVRDTVQAIAGELTHVWELVKPAEASVEFGLQLTAKAGKLTGLLVEGNGQASLKVTVTWKARED